MKSLSSRLFNACHKGNADCVRVLSDDESLRFIIIPFYNQPLAKSFILSTIDGVLF